MLTEMLHDNLVDILVVVETKLDDSYPDAQFYVDGYKLYRHDRDRNGGGVIVYIKSNIPSRERKDLNFTHTQSINIELTVNKIKWLLIGAYKPPSMKNTTFTNDFTKSLDKAIVYFDHIFLAGDLNFDLDHPDKTIM